MVSLSFFSASYLSCGDNSEMVFQQVYCQDRTVLGLLYRDACDSFMEANAQGYHDVVEIGELYPENYHPVSVDG